MLNDRRRQNDEKKALELCREAAAMYGNLGMQKHVEMAQRLMKISCGKEVK